jgi:hypothetical protein
MTTPHITQVRQSLLDTLADLRNRDNPMDVDRARAIAQVAGVLVDTAKAEVEYIKATGADRSEFLEAGPKTLKITHSTLPTANNPFPRQ